MTSYYNEFDPYAAQWLRCKKCGTEKRRPDFRPQRRTCKACDAAKKAADYAASPERHRLAVKLSRERNLARALVDGARKRAVKKGLAFDLNQHLDSLRVRLAAGYCELSGLPFQIGLGHHWASPAIDRIEPSSGYVYTNVRLVLHGLNNALGNWGEDVLFQMVDAMRARK